MLMYLFNIVWHHDTIAMMLPDKASDVEDADDDLFEEEEPPLSAKYVQLD